MNWPIKTLAELCHTTSGGTPSRTKPEYFNGSIPWVKSGDLTDGPVDKCEENISELGLQNSSAKVFQKGTILLAMYGATVGKLGYLSMEATTNQAVCGITPSKQVDRDFLFFYLLSKRSELIEKSTGGAQPNISQKIVRELLVPTPSLSEQRRIVDLLSRAEGIVRLRREAQAKAAEIIPALFLDMFGDPATNPKGWAEESLGELVEEFRYGTSQKSGDSGLATLRIPNVIGDRLDPSEMKLVSVAEAEANRLRLRAGDLLFVRTNGNPDYVGRSAVFDPEVMSSAGYDGLNCIYASYLIRARLKDNPVRPGFLQAFLSSREGRKRLREQARTSAGQYNINTEGLSSILVPVPTLTLQVRFEERCRSVLGIVAQQAAALKNAEAAFHALLSRVFSNEQAMATLSSEEAAVA